MPSSMKPDHLVEYANTTADFLNIRYFDGSLIYKVEISRRQKLHVFASCQSRARPPIILLMPCMLYASQYELEEIISHELIHVAQGLLNLHPGHGREFKSIARKFGIPEESGNRCSSVWVRSPEGMRNGKPEIVRPGADIRIMSREQAVDDNRYVSVNVGHKR